MKTSETIRAKVINRVSAVTGHKPVTLGVAVEALIMVLGEMIDDGEKSKPTKKPR